MKSAPITKRFNGETSCFGKCMSEEKKIEERFPTLREIKENAMIDSLNRHRGNKTQAARELDISLRMLRSWINGINRNNRRKPH